MLAVIMMAGPALAGRASFSTGSFQVFGGMDGGSFDVTTAQRATREVPERLRSRVIEFSSALPEGSILVRTGERRLYFILGEGKAVEYHVGVGREGFTWSGTNTISRKAQWPDWRPPPEMIARERKRGRNLPSRVPGGPNNPLGARALYIGDTAFRVHGTTEPWTIGLAVSSGCIRMINADVIDLYDRVAIGATVVVEQ